jgi:hypothetical protein
LVRGVLRRVYSLTASRTNSAVGRPLAFNTLEPLVLGLVQYTVVLWPCHGTMRIHAEVKAGRLQDAPFDSGGSE